MLVVGVVRGEICRGWKSVGGCGGQWMIMMMEEAVVGEVLVVRCGKVDLEGDEGFGFVDGKP